ncbi:TPR-REGION domain-containing protein [Mycena kentingensis (nom. inval.)]|nr:TPR-REGION domain-containing protein [Mycena kentingensis (nom. inval.)]
MNSHLAKRYEELVWTCLDADLCKSAVFYAERYFAILTNHNSRHLYATALLRQGQPHAALSVVANYSCGGCFEVKAKCCTALGRHRQAKDALDASIRDPAFTSSASSATRPARSFPDEAALRCRAGNMALKGNLPDDASHNFRQALALNPLIWEAVEGLCAVGAVPEIDDIFPHRPPPVKRAPPVDSHPRPMVPSASGAGFFTPGAESGSSGNLFRHAPQPQPFRIVPNDSIDISFQPQDTTFQQVASARSQHANASRPLSSADEAGPVAKKLRSAAPHAESSRSTKPPRLTVDEPQKKAGARPSQYFLPFSSLTLSPPRHGQPMALAIMSQCPPPDGTLAQPALRPQNRTIAPRFAGFFYNLNGAGYMQQQQTNPRGRRRQPAQSVRSPVESDMEDDFQAAYSPSPPANTQSPRSDRSPSPNQWTAAHEQAAQEAYEWELADYEIYHLVRQFACAAKMLSIYDAPGCLSELEKLPDVQQRTPLVLSMVGKAHYEQLQYSNAERAFKHLRILQPYRLVDMEVYSTLLWHLQRNVELSFLAQELLGIEPKSAEAWIAIGNLFSLQKERAQALTCFRRAAQMDPSCAYAYTLSGHETIDEDVDKAISFFQSALRADPRHYNAWYGLGTCYLRMSKVRLAEYHFRKAMQIHPTNAVLIGCVGMTVERRGDRSGALALFDEAVRHQPDNALVRYRRAKVHIAVRNYRDAIQDLETLRNTSPEESNVVFQLAKVYRLVGDELKSAQLLAIARDIAPKSLSKIKKLLDTVKADESTDDRMDEG